MRSPPAARASWALKAALLPKSAPSRVEMPPPSHAPPGARDPHACLLLAMPGRCVPGARAAGQDGGQGRSRRAGPARLDAHPPRHPVLPEAATPRTRAQCPAVSLRRLLLCGQDSPARAAQAAAAALAVHLPEFTRIFLWFLPDTVCGHGVASLCLFVCLLPLVLPCFLPWVVSPLLVWRKKPMGSN